MTVGMPTRQVPSPAGKVALMYHLVNPYTHQRTGEKGFVNRSSMKVEVKNGGGREGCGIVLNWLSYGLFKIIYRSLQSVPVITINTNARLAQTRTQENRSIRDLYILQVSYVEDSLRVTHELDLTSILLQVDVQGKLTGPLKLPLFILA